jgi:hypothetical protein
MPAILQIQKPYHGKAPGKNSEFHKMRRQSTRPQQPQNQNLPHLALLTRLHLQDYPYYRGYERLTLDSPSHRRHNNPYRFIN